MKFTSLPDLVYKTGGYLHDLQISTLVDLHFVTSRVCGRGNVFVMSVCVCVCLSVCSGYNL